MNERDLYPEIEHTCDANSLYWKKSQDLRFVNRKGQVVDQKADPTAKAKKPKPADADFCWLFPQTGLGAIVEVKYKKYNFPFAEIRQRDLLMQFAGMAWIWLFMGERIGGKEYPRRAWLVPWLHWRDTELTFRFYGLEGMAYSTPMKLEHRALHLSAVEQLAAWELQYVSGEDRWAFPECHPVQRLFCPQP